MSDAFWVVHLLYRQDFLYQQPSLTKWNIFPSENGVPGAGLGQRGAKGFCQRETAKGKTRQRDQTFDTDPAKRLHLGGVTMPGLGNGETLPCGAVLLVTTPRC